MCDVFKSITLGLALLQLQAHHHTENKQLGASHCFSLTDYFLSACMENATRITLSQCQTLWQLSL